MGIQDIAVAQAISRLDAIGAKYHVSFNGVTYGKEIGAPEKTRRPRGPSYHSIFVDKLDKAAVGDVVILDPIEGDTPVRLQSNASAYCTQVWGKGNYMTSVNQGRLEVLRIR